MAPVPGGCGTDLARSPRRYPPRGLDADVNVRIHSSFLRHARTLALAAAGVLVACIPATAQSSGDGGPWWSVSASAAGARLTCDFCDPARDLGAAVDLAMGVHVGSAARFGIAAGGWSHVQDETRESVLRAGLTGQIHPITGSGFHLIGGLGWSGYRAGDLASDVVRVSLGAGWDLPIPVGERWRVGSMVLLDAASFGGLRGGETPVASEVGLSVMRFGVYVRRR